MKTTRNLSLKRETFTELSADDLAVVLGGQDYAPSLANTCPLVDCLIDCLNSRRIPCTV